MFGYSGDELAGKNFQDISRSDRTKNDVIEAMNDHLQSGKVIIIIIIIIIIHFYSTSSNTLRYQSMVLQIRPQKIRSIQKYPSVWGQ